MTSETQPILWQQNVRSKWVFVNLIIELIPAAIFIYFFRDPINIFISIVLAIPAVLLICLSRTTNYSITSDYISIKWRQLGFKKEVKIPFHDITSINLVEYNDSNFSTIFFGTKKEYPTKKINFDRNEPRPHITFENIKKGKEVMQLLHSLWQQNDKVD